MPLTHITTCTLCDPGKPQKFTSQAITMVKPGEPFPADAVKFFDAIGDHFKKKHPEALVEVEKIATMMLAMIVLKNFSTSDPGVHRSAENIREFIHRLTLAPHMLSNAWLDGVYRQMCEDSPTGAIRFEEFQRLRDILLEEAQTAPDARISNGRRETEGSIPSPVR